MVFSEVWEPVKMKIVGLLPEIFTGIAVFILF